MNQDHPFAAVRVREARKWSQTEGFRIVSGLLDGRIAICPECHQVVEPGWAFCRHCGHRL
jgi:predicted PP-loop superfamily ATPase